MIFHQARFLIFFWNKRMSLPKGYILRCKLLVSGRVLYKNILGTHTHTLNHKHVSSLLGLWTLQNQIIFQSRQGSIWLPGWKPHFEGGSRRSTTEIWSVIESAILYTYIWCVYLIYYIYYLSYMMCMLPGFGGRFISTRQHTTSTLRPQGGEPQIEASLTASTELVVFGHPVENLDPLSSNFCRNNHNLAATKYYRTTENWG